MSQADEIEGKDLSDEHAVVGAEPSPDNVLKAPNAEKPATEKHHAPTKVKKGGHATRVGALTRIGQRMKESFGSVTKTPYDTRIIRGLQHADSTKEAVEKIIDQIEATLQPDPAVRMTSLVPDGLNKYEQLGLALTNASIKVGEHSPIGKSLVTMADAENRVGHEEQSYIKKVDYHVLQELQKFIDTNYKETLLERKKLNDRRLEMDAMINKTRKAKKKEEADAIRGTLLETTAAYEQQASRMIDVLEEFTKVEERIRLRVRDFLKAQINFHNKASDLLTDALQSY